MSCFFMPMHPMYALRPMRAQHTYYHGSCSPCGFGFNPLCLLFLVLFGPCLIRALFVLAPLIHVGFIFAMIALTSSLLSEVCADNESSSEAGTCRDKMRTCFAKMADVAKRSSTQCPDVGDRSEEQKRPFESKKACTTAKGAASSLCKRDLSSVRFEEASSSEPARVLVACPGVAATDLDVSILPDGEMHIQGTTAHHGGEVFAVDRRIKLSLMLDPESAECSAADGMLTVTIKRKAGKRIVVNAARKEEAAEQAEQAESSEGEWVEPAVKEAATKKKE